MQDKKSLKKAAMRRRNIIKSTVGGAAAAVILPAQWSTPVLNTVLTPTHAQTSSSPVIIAGVYASIAPIALNWPATEQVDSQYALLDLLIAPAKAQSYAPEICAEGGEFEGPTDDAGNSTLFIRVNEDQTVDFAIDSLGTGDIGSRPPCNLTAAVSVNSDGMSIPDVALPLRPDEEVQLSGMSQTEENEISGMYALVVGGGSPICSGVFTVVIGAIFPQSVNCLID